MFHAGSATRSGSVIDGACVPASAAGVSPRVVDAAPRGPRESGLPDGPTTGTGQSAAQPSRLVTCRFTVTTASRYGIPKKVRYGFAIDSLRWYVPFGPRNLTPL